MAERRMKVGIIASPAEDTEIGHTFHYHEIQEMAQAAERIGLDSFWLSDHFLFRMPNEPEGGQWDAFTFLGGLAATTTRIQLGPLVAATSFRNPALLAKMADSLDEMSGGRFLLGIGAGWHEPEYTAFGYPFDHLASRFEESLKIIAPLLREGHVDFQGTYVWARDSVVRPRGPSKNGPPLWIGASKPRMLRLVAQYADVFNSVWHRTPEKAATQFDAFRAACHEVGRDPATVQLSAGTLAHVLAPGESPKPGEPPIVGTPEQVAEALAAFANVGTQHLIVVLDPPGVEGIERFAPVLELMDAR